MGFLGKHFAYQVGFSHSSATVNSYEFRLRGIVESLKRCYFFNSAYDVCITHYNTIYWLMLQSITIIHENSKYKFEKSAKTKKKVSFSLIFKLFRLVYITNPIASKWTGIMASSDIDGWGRCAELQLCHDTPVALSTTFLFHVLCHNNPSPCWHVSHLSW